MKSEGAILRLYCFIALSLVMGCSDPPVETSDDSPPAQIDDLQVLSVDESEVELSWTAPGDDGLEGTASLYRVSFSEVPIEEAADEDLVEASSPPTPTEAGSTQSMTIGGLSSGQTYYFAIETADEVPNWSPVSNVVEATTTETTGSCDPLPIAERENCLDDIEHDRFLDPFGMLGCGDGSSAGTVQRFVEAPSSELHICDDYGDSQTSLEIAWWIWRAFQTTRAIHDELLSSCDPFINGPGAGFEQRLGEVEGILDECIVGRLFPARPGYIDQLREGGQLHQFLYSLLNLTSTDVAAEIPADCVATDCVVDAFYDEPRAEVVRRIYQTTGFVVQSWSSNPYEEAGTWTLDDLHLVEEVLGELLDCDRMGSIFRFQFLPVRHLSLLGEEEIDAGHDPSGFSISHYFMYDDTGAPSPDRLRFVLGHEMAHAATDEVGIRLGFDPRVFHEDSVPDPERYYDPEYIDFAEGVGSLDVDLVIVGQPRQPQGFRNEDLDSGRLNFLLLENGRSLPFIRNPAVVSVDDMYSDTPVYSDGLIRSENARGYRESIADLIIAFKELPHLFFESDRLIAPEGYFFVRENFFGGRDSLHLTPAQSDEVARVEALGDREARHADFQIVAAELRAAYCATEPEACPVYELPEPVGQQQEDTYGVLEQLALRGRDERLDALRNVLEGASLPFDEEVTAGQPNEEIRNFVITIGNGPVRVAIGAHWDAKGGSRGAVDNGSGVAVLLHLAMELSSTPPDGFSVQLILFDREEEGMLGSREFVLQHSGSLPPILINVDMCGFGDTLMVGPTEGTSTTLLEALRDASEGASVPIAEFPFVPSSDHESFLEEGVASVMLTMLPSTDIDAFRSIFEDEFTAFPEILTIKDTQFDALQQIEPASLVQCHDFISAVIDSL